MRFPWANTLLLLFIVAELVSGLFGLLSGSPDRAVFMQVHRVAGYGILGTLLWKGVNVARSLQWPRARTTRTASIVLLAALLITLGLGFAWAFVGPFSWLLFSGMSWHIYVGASLVPILVWHSIYHTRGFPPGFWADRRLVLRLVGLGGVGVAAWQLGEWASSTAGLSGAARRFTGSYEAGSFSGNAFPRVSWLNDRPAPVDESLWRLSVMGMVEREMSLGYQQLPLDTEMAATIDCTGGWHSTQEWRGVPVARLLDAASPAEAAASVRFTSVTGYYRRFSLDEARGFLLATHVGGETLSHGHGFPLRLVAPGKRGFEWVKWVESIELDSRPAWLQPPLPLQ